MIRKTDIFKRSVAAALVLAVSIMSSGCSDYLRKVVKEKVTDEVTAQMDSFVSNPVPFLEDVLDFFKGCENLYVEFEMKTGPEHYPEPLLHKFCEDIYTMVMAAKPKDALFVFTSFDPRPLLYLRAHHPDAEVMYITGKPCSHETVDLCKALGIKRLAATVNGSSRAAVKYAHDNGLLVSLWPGQKCADSHLAFLMGSDYLCTDIPQEMMQYIKDNKLPIVY